MLSRVWVLSEQKKVVEYSEVLNNQMLVNIVAVNSEFLALVWTHMLLRVPHDGSRDRSESEVTDLMEVLRGG